MKISRVKNGWRIVWLLAVYDCPMTEREERRDYTIFRKKLLQENFLQLQYSLYVKHYATYAQATAVIERIKPNVPEGASLAFFFRHGQTMEYDPRILWSQKDQEKTRTI